MCQEDENKQTVTRTEHGTVSCERVGREHSEGKQKRVSGSYHDLGDSLHPATTEVLYLSLASFRGPKDPC